MFWSHALVVQMEKRQHHQVFRDAQVLAVILLTGSLLTLLLLYRFVFLLNLQKGFTRLLILFLGYQLSFDSVPFLLHCTFSQLVMPTTSVFQIKSNQIYFSVAGNNNTLYKSIHIKIFVSDIAIFVLKRDVRLQLT